MRTDISVGLGFADVLCRALGSYTFVAIGQIGDAGESVSARGRWVGTKLAGSKPQAPYAALTELGEVFHAGAEVADNDLFVGVRSRSQQWDNLLAAIVLYSLEHEVRLHHVGERFPTREQLELKAELFYGGISEGISVPADDHERIYFPMSVFPGERFYKELQFFPGGPHDRARHVDLVTPNPKDLLRFVAGACGGEPELFDPVPENGPVGMFWTEASEFTSLPLGIDRKLGVMARSIWWEVS